MNWFQAIALAFRIAAQFKAIRETEVGAWQQIELGVSHRYKDATYTLDYLAVRRVR